MKLTVSWWRRVLPLHKGAEARKHAWKRDCETRAATTHSTRGTASGRCRHGKPLACFRSRSRPHWYTASPFVRANDPNAGETATGRATHAWVGAGTANSPTMTNMRFQQRPHARDHRMHFLKTKRAYVKQHPRAVWSHGYLLTIASMRTPHFQRLFSTFDAASL